MLNTMRRLRGASTGMLFALASIATLHAQTSGQSGFQAVPGGVVVQEQVRAAPLVVTAYACVWIVLIAYVFLLWRRLGRVERDLVDVTKKVQAKSR